MQPCNPIGYVHSLESFGSVDGPGVRFVVFLQGCALRCKYCHNPETWAAEGGEEWTAEKLFQRVYRYRNYWGKKGGITVSGGEPLRQMEFLTAFFELARSKGVHTALDTAGQPFRPDDPDYLAGFDRLMKSTSLVILDLKEIDPERHRQLTGKDNANILAMARHISDLGIPLWIRHVLVPGTYSSHRSVPHVLYQSFRLPDGAGIQDLPTTPCRPFLPLNSYSFCLKELSGSTISNSASPAVKAYRKSNLPK